MWRIVSSIPRVLRQQFNSSVRHTQACLDEESKQKNAKKVGFESHQDGDKTKVARLDWDPGREKYHDWKKSRCREDFWSTITHHQSVLEALRWGAAVATGIHLTKPIFCPQAELERRKKSVVEELALHVTKQPCVLAGAESILPLNTRKIPQKAPDSVNETTHTSKDVKSPQTSGTSDSKPPDLLDVAIQQFHELCDSYLGTHENMKALAYVKKQDYATAVHHWQRANSAGYSKASYNLGVCYEHGLGISIDLTKAEECYRTAAAKGHKEAMFNLASLLLKRPESQKELAYEWIEKAAEQGLKKAKTELAIHYLETRGKPKNKAGSLLEDAADKQSSRDQYYLAICYENGWGVVRNECKAAHLYSEAANSGHQDAMFSLGTFFEYGLGGLPEDAETAMMLYRQTADGGHFKAKERLQKMLAFEALQEWHANEELRLSPKRTQSITSKLHRSKTQLGASLSSKQGYEVQMSASSPSLTEYLRQQISELCNTPVAGASSIPQFFIGVKEEDVQTRRDDMMPHFKAWRHSRDMRVMKQSAPMGNDGGGDCVACTT